MKKIISILICIVALFTIFGCTANNDPTNKSVENSQQSVTSQNSTETQNSQQTTSVNTSSTQDTSISINDADRFKDVTYNAGQPQQAPVIAKPKIFLAGDSTVKTYDEKTYIGGWGQYLQAFLNAENVTVVNMSNGGRSSRSFINEGRLFTNPAINTTSYTSIESEISAGDYLLIQFGHNDDDTQGGFTNYVDRRVPLGTADAGGIFPTVIPSKMASTKYLPKAYDESAVLETEKTKSKNTIKTYGDYYYSYDCGGTYKGYLKMYVDFARSKGAIPILCTPVARVKFDSAGTTLIGGAGRHGANFEYVQAVRQLAQEENCMIIDMFNVSREFLEIATKTDADYMMALKPNSISGAWPTDYDLAFNDRTTYKVTGIEATHYNKYGAYIQAGKMAEIMLEYSNTSVGGIDGEKINFASSILTTPTTFVAPSTLMKSEVVNGIKAKFTQVSISE